jgi:hypothetical protein
MHLEDYFNNGTKSVALDADLEITGHEVNRFLRKYIIVFQPKFETNDSYAALGREA